MGHGESEAGSFRRSDTRKSICNDISGTRLVFNSVVEAEKFGQICLLFGSLNDLRHEVLQTPVVREDGEGCAKQIMMPFPHCRRNGV